MAYCTTTSVLLLFISCLIQEILAEYCGENIFCHPPYRCCQVKKGCCYDSMLHTNRHLRLQIWNMWYFWFLIIFMMMSCFGGCGYYRRRRLAMLTRGSANVTRPVTVLTSQQRSQRVQNDRNRPVNMYSYTGPGIDLTVPTTNLPPAYSEVVSQPGLYPVNKSDLPPYPGFKPDDCVQGVPMCQLGGVPNIADTCMPPPYSECPPEEAASSHYTHHQVNGLPVQQPTPLPPNTNNTGNNLGTSEQPPH